ncbi:hypothetical protein Ancab_032922 [Ancistrocladus abbreviatus]
MGLSVRRQEAELVAPAKPTPTESKELSDIDDQGTLRIQVPAIMAYKSTPSMEGKDPARMIKEALARALVYYYPLAGRLREGHNRKLIVDCTGEGVLFIEADAAATLEELGEGLLPPCPLLDELLFDVPGSQGITGCPVLLFQVTRLTCGGFILGIRYNHTMCDIFGLVQLLNATIDMAGGAHFPSTQPLWRRELFKARNPPFITRVHHEFEEGDTKRRVVTLQQDNTNQVLVQKSFSFGPKAMQAIRNHLPAHLHSTCTNFELLSAYLWRCRTIALQPNPDDTVRVTCIVSLRSNNCVPLPSGYYGNALALPAVATKAKPLCESSLEYALKLVKEAKAKMNEEYLRSVVDYMVLKGRPNCIEHLNWIVADTAHCGIEKVDFGWELPVYSGVVRSFPVISNFGRLKKGSENVITVPMCLAMPIMSRFEHEVLRMTTETMVSDLVYVKPPTIRSML